MTIEIKANSKVTSDKYTLNYISILANEAAAAFEAQGAYALAKEAKEVAEVIYKALEEKGLYNQLD